MTVSKDCAGAVAPARFLCIAEAWIAEKVTIESPELEAPALTDVSDSEVTPTTTPVVPTEAVVTPNSAPVVLTAPTEPETSTEPEETTESTEPVEMPASIKSVDAWQWVDELEIIDLELNVATIPGISAGGTLPDGTEISVSGAPAGAKWLEVRKIGQEETGPYTYFWDTIGRDKGSFMQAYEIYCLTADRQRLPAIWRTSGYTP